MMNLSINLTLGSPGAESVLNTAPAPEDGAVDSFSLKLADELSEQELTPPIRVEDTRAVDPALLEAIAARQKLAADSEAASAKDGRVWLDDPLAGLPAAAENEAELTETVTEDKPWFDIIEKAKSYGPALQANKTSGDVNPDTASIADQAVLLDVDTTETPPVSAEALSAALAGATDTTPVETAKDTGSAVTKVAAVDSDAASQVGQTTSLATEQALLSAEEPTAAGLTTPDLTEQNQTAAVTSNAVASTATDEKVGNEIAVAPGAPQRAVTTEAATTQNKSTTKSEQPRTEQSSAVKASGKTAAVHEPVNESSDAESGPVVSTGALTESPAEQAAKQAQAPQTSLTQQPAKATAQQSAVALHENAEVVERTEPELPAAMMVQAQAAPANSNRAAAAAGSLDKAPAANAFAEHLKTVNQTQQQQQQAGAEQQTGQGQAKATADVMLATQPAQPAATTQGFGQQLQQLQQAQPLTEHTAGATALTQPVTHSTGTAHTPLMSNRAAETTSWQAPLALTEPAAAQQLKDRVMVQIQHKLQTAEVQLHPEDMGSMQIKLNLQQDQLSVQFVVQQGAAKEALEQQMPKLRELLEQQGIALTEGQVEQRQSGGQQEQRQARSGPSGGNEADLATVQTVQMKVSDRMVDFYA